MRDSAEPYQLEAEPDLGARAHTEGPPYGEPIYVEAELIGELHDPEPAEFCAAHMPDGTQDPCARCMRARHIHERWEDRNPGCRKTAFDRKAAHNAELFKSLATEAQYEAIETRNCPLGCDGMWRETSDGVVTRCTHTPTSEEIPQ